MSPAHTTGCKIAPDHEPAACVRLPVPGDLMKLTPAGARVSTIEARQR
jgi:hypothetical protein